MRPILPLRGSALIIATLTAASVVGTTLPARAVTVDPASGPDYEVPFLCGESWTGTSRSQHSPSYWSIDWNRPGDDGHPILAAAPGVVTKVVPDGTTGYGRYTIIDHGNGRSTLYAHMKQTFLVPGMQVDQSDPVGLLGGTGNVTGPHLHFEERSDSTTVAPYFHRKKFSMNSTIASQNCPDSPITGDWDGSGSTDVGTFSRAASGITWKRLLGTTTSTITGFGTGWDRVFTGDWNGDGKTEVGVRPPNNTKFVQRLADGTLNKISYGPANALPVTGDWNGDRRTDVGVFAPDLSRFSLRSASGATTYVKYGKSGDRPVTGDWDGNGTAEVGIYRASTKSFMLRKKTGSAVATVTVPLGAAGDLPVTGDWNGDKITDVGVWSPTKGTFTLRYVARGSTNPVVKTVTYGAKRG